MAEMTREYARPRALDRARLIELASRYGMLSILLVLVAMLSALSPTFRNPENLLNVLQQNSIIGIVACGMLLMILLGGFDLSVGAVGALSACVAAAVVQSTMVPLGFALALIAGLSAGLINGVLIARIGMNPFVATLGMQSVVYGVLFVSTNATPIYPTSDVTYIGLGRFGPLPVAVLVYASVVAITFVLLRATTFGHYIYAVGGNRDASRLAGINVDRVTVATYAIGGLFAAIGGLVMLGQTNIGQPNAAIDWPLVAIAAVVVGGVPLSGGQGGVVSCVVGTLLLGIVANALNLFGISPYWQRGITGLVVLAAVGLDSYQRKRRSMD